MAHTMLMKTFLISITLFFLIISNCSAQQQWKFHIAFEDATGAKDTIWMLYDTTAHGTLPTDTALGEGAFNFNYNSFNVWIYNYDGDSTKTFALPYIGFPYHAAQIRAFNYQYPLTVLWDTSLFHAPYLPYTQGAFNIARIDNDYFFFVNNCLPCQYFNMLTDDHLTAPSFAWGSQSQFPFNVIFSYEPTDLIEFQSDADYISVFPNPAQNDLTVTSNIEHGQVSLYNLVGQKIMDVELNYEAVIDLADYPRGMYVVEIENRDTNSKHHENIVLQ